MNWNKPSWYITPKEFADVIVQALEQSNHFKKDEPAHPEDLVIAFVAHAEAVALGMGFAGCKVSQSQKEAVMKTGDLKKEIFNKYNVK